MLPSGVDRAAAADLQGAGADRGDAAVGVAGAGEDQQVGAQLHQRAAAGDVARDGRRAGVEVKGQCRGGIGEIDVAGAAAIVPVAPSADLQGAGIDGGQAGVGVTPARTSLAVAAPLRVKAINAVVPFWMMPLKVLLEPEVGASVRVAVLLAVVFVTVPLPVSEPSVVECCRGPGPRRC